MKQFLLHKLQTQNTQVWAVFWGRKLHFLAAYGSYTFYQPMAELWHSLGNYLQLVSMQSLAVLLQ